MTGVHGLASEKPEKFLLTRPMRDVTLIRSGFFGTLRFLLTRPMRDVTNFYFHNYLTPLVSTHTPHAGRDLFSKLFTILGCVSTHTPHAGRDGVYTICSWLQTVSTHTPHAGRDREH